LSKASVARKVAPAPHGSFDLIHLT